MKVYYPFLSAILLLSIGALKADLILVGDEEPSLEGVSIGTPVVNGSGCRQGTAFTILDKDTKELLLVFDDYLVEAYGSSRTARKNCSLAIPIHLPKGISVSLISQKIEGFNMIPEGASTVLSTESFFAGSQGDVLTTRFDGALEDIFEVNTALPVETTTPTSTGQDIILRVNTSLRVKTNRYGDYALAGIAAIGEKENSLKYQLKFAKCD